MSPFSGAKSVPKGWSRHHTAAATGGMNATVTVGQSTSPAVYDPDTDDTTRPWTVDYDGPARIQALNQVKATELAAQHLTGRAYLVQLDFELACGQPFPPGRRVRVLRAVNDRRLVEQDLWVVDEQLGSERFTRDLICTDNQTDLSPTGPH